MKTTSRVAFSLLAVAGMTIAAEKWPTEIKQRANIAKLDPDKDEKGFHYQSDRFQIHSDTELTPEVLGNLAKSAENTMIALEKIPLSFGEPNGIGKIFLFSTEEAFLKAGGPARNAGYYDGRSRRILIRLDELLRKNGFPPDYDLLAHEVGHFGTHNNNWKRPQWFNEGVSEYLAAAQVAPGHLRFNKIETDIRDHILKHQPPNATEVRAMKIASLIDLNKRTWIDNVQQRKNHAVFEPYTSSLLLTHYLFHGGKARREQFEDYLTLIAKTPISRKITPIFSDKEAPKLEAKLTRYWGLHGLKLRFQ